MPDPSYIFGLAFVALALVGVFAIFRALSTRSPGGGPHGKRTSMGERGATDVGSPLFPPRPEVVSTDEYDPEDLGPSGPDDGGSLPGQGHGHQHHPESAGGTEVAGDFAHTHGLRHSDPDVGGHHAPMDSGGSLPAEAPDFGSGDNGSGGPAGDSGGSGDSGGHHD